MVDEGVVIVLAVVDALEDVEDDGGEAVLVEVDFLVVGDLADVAGGRESGQRGVEEEWRWCGNGGGGLLVPDV